VTGLPRRSLRRSLLAGVVGLTAAALLLAGAVGAVVLRAHLLDRTDEQLRAAAVLVQSRTALLTGAGEQGATLRSVVSVTDYLVEVRRPGAGTVRLLGGPPLPAQPLLDLARAEEPDPQTVEAPSGRYRAVVVRDERATVLVALPLEPVRATVARQAAAAGVTALVVLALLAGLARGLVRHRLRPLDEIAAAATALAGGDLDRRVAAPAADGPAARTEVGRLSVAINGMLARIQAALADRERSERRMREFVADASHELRTPVTAIRGYLQLVRTGVVDLRERPDVLRRLEQEADRMGALVADLLYLARLDADPPPRAERLDLAAVVRDAVTDARAVEPDRPLEVRVPDRCDVTGDPGALHQAVANLLANVRAHTPRGTPARVTLTVADGRARVTVADDGPGMPGDAAAHAFDRFWRAEQARAATGGAGLGLAIVAGVARGHGGAAGISSAPGRGATVWFTVPVDS
jgi:two-component system OmpR family sensor kinase